MKITVSIPTRRPHMLAGMIHSFYWLMSRRHEVQFVVGVDKDDSAATAGALQLHGQYRVNVMQFDRQPALGSYHNIMHDNFPADVYTTLCDDVVCATYEWDEAIAQAATASPADVWFWDTPESRRAIYPIVTERFRQANHGRVFTNFFPYWWDDAWLNELYCLIHGSPPSRLEGAGLSDIPHPTTRMRDIQFWSAWYEAMRPARIGDAVHIVRQLGYPVEDRQIIARASVFGVNPDFERRMEEIQENQGDKGPPTPSYLTAVARAKEIAEKYNLTLPSEVAA